MWLYHTTPHLCKAIKSQACIETFKGGILPSFAHRHFSFVVLDTFPCSYDEWNWIFQASKSLQKKELMYLTHVLHSYTTFKKLFF